MTNNKSAPQKLIWQIGKADGKNLIALLENDRKANDELTALLALSKPIKDNTNNTPKEI
ncbi:Uncharacterised protein [Moraxella caprae]|uniref:Uncharacterized protein n=1 Tax=Moraxella caprae TaxID=90240 RepID=A0A378R3R0_9GAMM|nr:hypothetical protein [Moraxella caprae]STZ09429.1 Uncharacterised protein [Moraxella caprae]